MWNGTSQHALTFADTDSIGRKQQTVKAVVGEGRGEEGCASRIFGVHDEQEQSERKLQVLFGFAKARLSGFVPS